MKKRIGYVFWIGNSKTYGSKNPDYVEWGSIYFLSKKWILLSVFWMRLA